MKSFAKGSRVTVNVIGLGFVGMPTAALLASNGVKVIGVDLNEDLISQVNTGSLESFEPYLPEMVANGVESGLLIAKNKPVEANVFLICVPTPISKGTNTPDLSFIRSAIESISTVVNEGNLIIIESTCPVGTTEEAQSWLSMFQQELVENSASKQSINVNMAYCPERVMPGNAIFEIKNNPRVVGGLTAECTDYAHSFLTTYLTKNCVKTNARTAEMVKLVENSFRDVGIAFANEVSMLCDAENIDTTDLINLANLHPRVDILEPGPGVGGHCIAVDPWFLIDRKPQLTHLIRTARKVNSYKPLWVVKKIHAVVHQLVQANHGQAEIDIRIELYGLTYKKDINDFRESPALEILKNLLENFSGKINAIDPYVDSIAMAQIFPSVSFNKQNFKPNISVLLVGHAEFKDLKKSFTSDQSIIDTVGLWI